MFTPQLFLVTCPDLESARKLAGVLLGQRMAACVNIIPGVESHYRWEGELELSSEVLLLIKSSAEQASELEKVICTNHPYTCPEIIAWAPTSILPQYRAWWQESLEGRPTRDPSA